jgi:hypothetical protein
MFISGITSVAHESSSSPTPSVKSPGTTKPGASRAQPRWWGHRDRSTGRDSRKPFGRRAPTSLAAYDLYRHAAEVSEEDARWAVQLAERAVTDVSTFMS